MGTQDYLNPTDGPEGYADGTESAEEPFDASLLDEQPLPPVGDYPNVICTEASLARSKKGNAMVVVTLSTEDGAASAKYYIVNSKGSQRYTDGIAVFGLTQPDVKSRFESGGPAGVAALFVGKKVSAKGIHETYLGAKQFKFDQLAPPAEGAGFRAFGSDDA